MKKIKTFEPEMEYTEFYLTSVISFWVNEALKDKYWQTVSIDVVNNKIVFKRLKK